MLNIRKFFNGLRIYPKTVSGVDSQGEMDVTSGNGKINYHNGTTPSPMVTETHASQGANRLQNKDLDDATVAIVDSSDTTKKILFNASGTTGTSTTITAAQTANRVWTLPDSTDTAVGLTTSQTLSNKTLDNTNVETIKDSNFTVQNAADVTKQLKLSSAGITAGQTRTLTAPDASTVIVGTDATQTLTNKTLSGNTATNLISGAGTLTLNTSGTVTLPNATDTLVGKTTADTLTNKTLTTPVISSITNGGTITIPSGTDTLVARATTDTLSNKTFSDSPIFTQISTPSTPSAGFNKIYPKADGNFYTLNSAGTEVKVGAGSGGINYITNPGAESDTSGWSGYSDIFTVTSISNASPAVITSTAHGMLPLNGFKLSTTGTLPNPLDNVTVYYPINITANTFNLATTPTGTAINTTTNGSGTHSVIPFKPIDGTGGSLATLGNLTFSRTTSGPLVGIGSFSIVAANASITEGQGVSSDFTIDSAFQASVLDVSFNYNATTNFQASDGTVSNLVNTSSESDLEVYIYDKTNATLIPVSPKVLTAKGANNFQFSGKFQTASNSTSYRLILHSSVNNGQAWTFLFDNVSVSPQLLVQGPPVTDWLAYTPTISAGFGSVSTQSFFYKREGDCLVVQGSFTAGTVAGTLASMTIPTGLSIDTSKISINNITSAVGAIAGFWTNNHSNATIYGKIITAPATSTTTVYFGIDPNGNSLIPTAANGNSVSFTGDIVSIYFKVPILGWSSNLQMSQDTDTRVVTATYTNNAGVSSGSTPITNGWSKVTDTHSAFNTSTGLYTVPVSGNYQVLWNTSVQGATSQADILKNGSTFVNGLGSGSRGTVNITIPCIAGDTLAPVEGFSTTMSANNSSTSFSITRVSGPQIIAVSESVNARYTVATGTLAAADNIVKYTTKTYDSHGAYNTSTGNYTVPSPGKYRITGSFLNAGTYAGGTASQIQIFKNGAKYVTFVFRGQAAIATSPTLLVTDTVNCVAGDTLAIFSNTGATSPAFAGTSDEYITIERVGN